MVESMRIEAVFGEPADVGEALRLLSETGFGGPRVEVRSSIPIPEVHLPQPPRRSRVPLATILGGILGGTTGYLVASLTALVHPIVTGDMPIVAYLPVGIITYEGTALGAILLTVAAVLLEGGILRRPPRRGKLDHRLAEGQILLTVTVAPTERARALAALEGALEVEVA